MSSPPFPEQLSHVTATQPNWMTVTYPRPVPETKWTLAGRFPSSRHIAKSHILLFRWGKKVLVSSLGIQGSIPAQKLGVGSHYCKSSLVPRPLPVPFSLSLLWLGRVCYSFQRLLHPGSQKSRNKITYCKNEVPLKGYHTHPWSYQAENSLWKDFMYVQ